MPAEKSSAIVLRVTEFSETSVVALLFTREFGQCAALAKGARRPKAPFEGALDLLALCEVLLLRKAGDALDLLLEAKLERSFRAARRDLARLYPGYYVAELLRELTDVHDPQPALFDAADAVLRELDAGGPPAALALRWELTALRLLGHAPSWRHCAACGDSVPPGSRTAFGLLAGGVLCANCRPGQRSVTALSREALDTLAVFAAGDESWRRLGLPPAVRGEVRGLMNQYVNHVAGKRLRLHAWLGEKGSKK